jgi:hypothetical protein
LAHHSLLWYPFPENRHANRTGGSAEPFFVGAAPQTGTDSNQGKAIVTPSPFRNVRRETEDVVAMGNAP